MVFADSVKTALDSLYLLWCGGFSGVFRAGQWLIYKTTIGHRNTTMKDKKTVKAKTEERRSNIKQTLETMLLEKAIIYFLSMMWLPEWLNQPRKGVPGSTKNRDWMKGLHEKDTGGGQNISKSAEKAWNYVLARRRHGICVLIGVLITMLCVTLLCTCHVDKEIMANGMKIHLCAIYAGLTLFSFFATGYIIYWDAKFRLDKESRFLAESWRGFRKMLLRTGVVGKIMERYDTPELKEGIIAAKARIEQSAGSVDAYKALFYDIYYKQIVSAASVSIQKEKEEGSKLDPVADSLTRENFEWLIRSAKFFGTPTAEPQLRVRVIHDARKLNGQKSPLPDNCDI